MFVDLNQLFRLNEYIIIFKNYFLIVNYSLSIEVVEDIGVEPMTPSLQS